MRIVGSGIDNKTMKPFEFTLGDGRAVGLATTEDHVVIEIQDLANTVYIHASVEELERAIRFCKEKASLIPCGCRVHKDDIQLPNEFTAPASE